MSHPHSFVASKITFLQMVLAFAPPITCALIYYPRGSDCYADWTTLLLSGPSSAVPPPLPVWSLTFFPSEISSWGKGWPYPHYPSSMRSFLSFLLYLGIKILLTILSFSFVAISARLPGNHLENDAGDAVLASASHSTSSPAAQTDCSPIFLHLPLRYACRPLRLHLNVS